MHALHNKRESVVAALGWGLALLFLASCCLCCSAADVETEPLRSVQGRPGLAVNSSLTFYSMDSLCALPPYSYTNRFNLTRIDPQTGLEMTTVYTSEDTCQLFQWVAPVGDPRTKRAFVCAYYRSEWYELWGEPMLTIYDLSNPNKAVPRQHIPLPIGPEELTVYTYASQIYDAATESVWIMCSSLDLGGKQTATFMVKVDLVKGIAYNVTSLSVPAQLSDQGNAVFNARTRRMWFPVIAGQAGSKHVLAEFDVDAAKFVNFYETNYTVESMVWDSTTDTTYGFLSGGLSLSYGVLQPGSGKWTILQEYSNFYNVGKMVLDPSTGLIYGEVSGIKPIQFVAFDMKTGTVQSMKNLPQTSNANLLFVL